MPFLHLRAHSYISDLKDQFQGYTEVSRCDGNANSWCCAGAAGQGLGGAEAVDCCSTNLTTALEPYPLATVEKPGTSRTTKTTNLPSVSSRTSLTISDETLTLSTTAPTRSSTFSSTSQGSGTVLLPASSASGSASSHPTKQSRDDSNTAVKIAVPMAVVVVVLLACLVFLILRRNQIQFLKKWRRRNDAQGKYARHPFSHASEHHELAGNSVQELDVTHYELPHPKAPRHELG